MGSATWGNARPRLRNSSAKNTVPRMRKVNDTRMPIQVSEMRQKISSAGATNMAKM